VVFQAWPRLSDWLREYDRDGPVRDGVDADSADWQEAGRDPSFVYRGPRLDQAVEFAHRRPDALTTVESEFVQAGIDGRRRARQAEVRDHTRRRLLGLALVALVVTASVGGWAVIQRQAAVRARAETSALRLAAEARAHIGDQRDLALLLAAEAVSMHPSVDTRAALQDVLSEQPLPERMSLPPGATPSSVMDVSGQTWIGRSDGLAERVGGGASVNSVRVSDVGLVGLTATSDGTVIGVDVGGAVRRIAPGQPAVQLASSGYRAIQPSAAPGFTTVTGADTVAVFADDRLVASWRIPSPQAPPVAAVAADRHTVVIGAGAQILLGDLDEPGQKLRAIAQLDGVARSVAVDAQNLAVVGDATGTVTRIDVSSDRVLPYRATTSTGEVVALAISPDGQWLAGGTNTNEIVVWDLSTMALHLGPVRATAAGHDPAGEGPAGTQLRGLSFSDDLDLDSIVGSSVIRWRLAPSAGLTVARQPTSFVQTLDVTPDGQAVVLGADGRVSIGGVEASVGALATTAVAATRLGLVLGHADGSISVAGQVTAKLSGPVTALAADPSGDEIVAATATSVRVLRPTPHDLPLGAGENLTALAIIPQTHRIVAAVSGSAITGTRLRVWSDPAAPNAGQVIDVGGSAPAVTLAGLPGDLLVTGGDDRTVRLVSPISGRVIQVLTAHGDGVVSLSAQGDQLWSSSQNGEVIHWQLDADGLEQVGQTIQVSTDSVVVRAAASAVFVATDGQLLRWPTDDAALIKQACELAHRGLTSAEQRLYQRPDAGACRG
jgi:WD40 repeat protein